MAKPFQNPWRESCRPDPADGGTTASVGCFPVDVLHFLHIDDDKFQNRFDRIEKRLEEGFTNVQENFTQVHGLIDALATTCAREFASINERFAGVDSRLEAIEGKIETFARRVDDEVESRHALGERVSKLEKTI